jgi:hypothetical protein
MRWIRAASSTRRPIGLRRCASRARFAPALRRTRGSLLTGLQQTPSVRSALRSKEKRWLPLVVAISLQAPGRCGTQPAPPPRGSPRRRRPMLRRRACGMRRLPRSSDPRKYNSHPDPPRLAQRDACHARCSSDAQRFSVL